VCVRVEGYVDVGLVLDYRSDVLAMSISSWILEKYLGRERIDFGKAVRK
jgi:hypothetical protein